MTAASNASAQPHTTVFAGLAPMVAIVFFGFLAIGTPLGALSLEVHEHLGFSAIAVGWVVGLQSLATVLTRYRAGILSDGRGPRRAVLIGLPLAAFAGVLYLLAGVVPVGAAGQLAIIVAGRLVMGLAESLFVTGAMSWGIARLGAARTGKVMSWQGIAMYAALGLGAPLGLALQSAFGFAGVAVATIAAPLLACAVAAALPPVPPSGGQRVAFHRVLGLIGRPGMVLALATVPFAAMATFLALDYAAQAWAGAGLSLAGFGTGYILVRLLGSHLPDRWGGSVVAAGSLAVEAIGQALLWLAPGAAVAALGATLTGIGFSLVFPSMGVVAAGAVPPAQRGRAVGGFMAFFDIALGLTGPVLGVAAERQGTATVFMVGAGAAAAALLLLPSVRRLRQEGAAR